MDPQFAPRCSLSRVVALEAGGVGSTGDVKESYDGCQPRAIPIADWRTPKASMCDNNNNNCISFTSFANCKYRYFEVFGNICLNISHKNTETILNMNIY